MSEILEGLLIGLLPLVVLAVPFFIKDLKAVLFD